MGAAHVAGQRLLMQGTGADLGGSGSGGMDLQIMRIPLPDRLAPPLVDHDHKIGLARRDPSQLQQLFFRQAHCAGQCRDRARGRNFAPA